MELAPLSPLMNKGHSSPHVSLNFIRVSFTVNYHPNLNPAPFYFYSYNGVLNMGRQPVKDVKRKRKCAHGGLGYCYDHHK